MTDLDDLIDRGEHAKEFYLLSEVSEDLLAALKQQRAQVQRVRELCDGFAEFYADRTDPFAEGVKHVVRDLRALDGDGDE